MWGLLRQSVKAGSSGIIVNTLQSNPADLERILEHWQDALAQSGLDEPSNALRELKKRINDGSKPKLNFSNCSLNDDHVIKLIEALAIKPVVLKLDLSANNFSDLALDYLIRLLKGQVKLSRIVDVDERLDVAFLSEVTVENSSQTLTNDKVTQVNGWTDCLKHANAKCVIRKIYRNNGAPERINKTFLDMVWKACFSSLESEANVCFHTARGSDECVGYETLENGILGHMVRKGVIPMLARWQMAELAIGKEEARRSTKASSSPSSAGPEGDETTSESPLPPEASAGAAASSSSPFSSQAVEPSTNNSSPDERSHSTARGQPSEKADRESRYESGRESGRESSRERGGSRKHRDKDKDKDSQSRDGSKERRGSRRFESPTDVMSTSHRSSSSSKGRDSSTDRRESSGASALQAFRRNISNADYAPNLELQAEAAAAQARADAAIEKLQLLSLREIPKRDSAAPDRADRPHGPTVTFSDTTKPLEALRPLGSVSALGSLRPLGQRGQTLTMEMEQSSSSTRAADSSANPDITDALYVQQFKQAYVPTSAPTIAALNKSVLPQASPKTISPTATADETAPAYPLDSAESSASSADIQNESVSAVVPPPAASQTTPATQQPRAISPTPSSAPAPAPAPVSHYHSSAPVPANPYAAAAFNHTNSNAATSPTSLSSPAEPKPSRRDSPPDTLDCSSQHLQSFSLSLLHYQLHPSSYAVIRMLILRDNRLSNVALLGLPLLTGLVDLDLSHNRFKEVPYESVPASVERLDLSHNILTSVSGLIHCHHLRTLNLANNNFRVVDQLPPSIRILDISNNKLENSLTLRMLSFCPRLSALYMEGNPVITKVREWRGLVLTYLPDLREIDGEQVAGAFLKRSDQARSSRSPPIVSAIHPYTTSASANASNVASRHRQGMLSPNSVQTFSQQRSHSPQSARGLPAMTANPQSYISYVTSPPDRPGEPHSAYRTNSSYSKHYEHGQESESEPEPEPVYARRNRSPELEMPSFGRYAPPPEFFPPRGNSQDRGRARSRSPAPMQHQHQQQQQYYNQTYPQPRGVGGDGYYYSNAGTSPPYAHNSFRDTQSVTPSHSGMSVTTGRSSSSFNTNTSKARTLSVPIAALHRQRSQSPSATSSAGTVSRTAQQEQDKERWRQHERYLASLRKREDKQKQQKIQLASRSRVITNRGVQGLVRRLSVSSPHGSSSNNLQGTAGDESMISHISGGSKSHAAYHSYYKDQYSSPLPSPGYSPKRLSSSGGRAGSAGRGQRLDESPYSPLPGNLSVELNRQLALSFINDWLLESSREMDTAAAILSLAYWMAEKADDDERVPTPSKVARNAHGDCAMGLSVFLRAIEPLAFVQHVRLPARVEEAISAVSAGFGPPSPVAMSAIRGGSGSRGPSPFPQLLHSEPSPEDLELLRSVGSQLERMVHFSSLLGEIKNTVLTSGTTDFASRLDEIMSSETGVFVNDTVLTPCGCEYVYLNQGHRENERESERESERERESDVGYDEQGRGQDIVATAAAIVEKHNRADSPVPPTSTSTSSYPSRVMSIATAPVMAGAHPEAAGPYDSPVRPLGASGAASAPSYQGFYSAEDSPNDAVGQGAGQVKETAAAASAAAAPSVAAAVDLPPVPPTSAPSAPATPAPALPPAPAAPVAAVTSAQLPPPPPPPGPVPTASLASAPNSPARALTSAAVAPAPASASAAVVPEPVPVSAAPAAAVAASPAVVAAAAAFKALSAKDRIKQRLGLK